ncbi:Aldehyde dehydrogenase [Venturia nashicola]|nr:Aldehyde dehydrogenase [Venturia nashicola]
MVVIFIFLSYISIILRLGTRKYYLKRLGWDDYIITVAAVFFSIYCSTVLAMFGLANGARGFEDVRPNHVGEVASLILVTECFYVLSMITLKLSLAIFFLRILRILWQRWIILTTITLTTVFGIVDLFFAIFQCGYFSEITIFVDRLVHNKCASKGLGWGINYTYAALATTSDWTCVLVPIFVLQASTMPTKRKVVVGGLMIFACLYVLEVMASPGPVVNNICRGSIASIVRMLYLHTISVPNEQYFVNVSNLSIWSTIEPGVGITVASLATLRPLFSSLVEKTRRSSVTFTASPHQTSSGDDTRTGAASMQTYTGDGSLGTSSDTTVVALSPITPNSGSFSKHEKRSSEHEKLEDIETEMRAYGMPGLGKTTTSDEADFNRYTPEVCRVREAERRMRWFQSQRAVRHTHERDSNEYISRTTTPSRQVSQNLSMRRQRVDERVEEWENDFTLDGQRLVDRKSQV